MIDVITGAIRFQDTSETANARRMKVTVEGNSHQVPLFEGLDEEQQRSLRAKMGQTTLRRGEILFEEGEQGNRLYIITEGKVKSDTRP